MKVVRLQSFNSMSKTKTDQYKLPEYEKTAYIVDDSCFVPVAEALKSINHNSVTTTEANTYYDFANGKDDGRRIPINRRHDMKDIAEITNAIMDEAKELADKKEALINKVLTEKAIADNAKKVNAQFSSPSPTPPSSPSK